MRAMLGRAGSHAGETPGRSSWRLPRCLCHAGSSPDAPRSPGTLLRPIACSSPGKDSAVSHCMLPCSRTLQTVQARPCCRFTGLHGHAHRALGHLPFGLRPTQETSHITVGYCCTYQATYCPCQSPYGDEDQQANLTVIAGHCQEGGCQVAHCWRNDIALIGPREGPADVCGSIPDVRPHTAAASAFFVALSGAAHYYTCRASCQAWKIGTHPTCHECDMMCTILGMV